MKWTVLREFRRFRCLLFDRSRIMLIRGDALCSNTENDQEENR